MGTGNPVSHEWRYPRFMRSTIFLMFAAALLCSAECTQVQPAGDARVEVSAFSLLGERIANAGVDLIEVGTRKSMRSEFRGTVARIPYGTYMLRVSAPGFRASERELRVDQPEVLVRIPLSVARECEGFAELGGSVQPAPRDRELWVKLVPVFGSGGAEARVSQDGAFLVSGLDDGNYLLLVLDRTTVVHTETLQIRASRRVRVNLRQQ